MAKYLISFPSAAMVVPEGEWEAVVTAIGRCHQAAIQNHARVITTITIDDRGDQTHHLDEMVAAVERHLGHSTKRVQ